MSNRPATASLSLLGSAGAEQISKRLAAEGEKMASLKDRLRTTEAERDEKKADPNVTAKTFRDISERINALCAEIDDTASVIEALRSQLAVAQDDGWIARKKKRLAEVRNLNGAVADAAYSRLNELLKEVFGKLAEIRAIYMAGEAFNSTSDERVGFVELAEYRVRHRHPGGSVLSPLWSALASLQPVFPGQAHFTVAIPSLPAEEPSPRVVAERDAAVAKFHTRFNAPQENTQPRFHAMPVFPSQAPPEEKPRGLQRIVHGTSPEPGPDRNTDTESR